MTDHDQIPTEPASGDLSSLTTEIEKLDEIFFGAQELQDIAFVEARYGARVAREFGDAIIESRDPHMGSTPHEPTESYTADGIARNGW